MCGGAVDDDVDFFGILDVALEFFEGDLEVCSALSGVDDDVFFASSLVLVDDPRWQPCLCEQDFG